MKFNESNKNNKQLKEENVGLFSKINSLKEQNKKLSIKFDELNLNNK